MSGAETMTRHQLGRGQGSGEGGKGYQTEVKGGRLEREMKCHTNRMLALASVYTVCCLRSIVTPGGSLKLTKTVTRLIVLSYPPNKACVCCDGGCKGSKPAQVSPECEFQVARWVIPHSSLDAFSKAPGRSDGTSTSIKVMLRFVSDKCSLINRPWSLMSPRDELHQQWVMAESCVL